MAENDHDRGFYQKYRVEKIEGETDPNAVYIVLRLDGEKNDPARKAILLFAALVAMSYSKFSDDLIDLVQKLDPEIDWIDCDVCNGTGENPDDYSECENCNGKGKVS